MSKPPHSQDHQHHEDHHHPHHNWHSEEYVSKWAEGQDEREAERRVQFSLMANIIPYEKTAAIRILDVGAGYGALTQFMLARFPNAAAVCLDNSTEMTALGIERMKDLKGRFSYASADLRKLGWSRAALGPFEAVVSAIAIHNVHEADIIRAVYGEIFPLVKKGGCFLNYEILTHPLAHHLEWLGAAGFEDVQSFWSEDRRALLGGFRK
jgi:ubiquinone/menaquinone biosynthesis C-methylase UbiE